MTPTDAARLSAARFADFVPVPAAEVAALPEVLAPLNIAGGAVYDALVGVEVEVVSD